MVLYNDIIRFEVIDKEASFIFEEVMQKVISTFQVLSFLVPPLKKENTHRSFPFGRFIRSEARINRPSIFFWSSNDKNRRD